MAGTTTNRKVEGMRNYIRTEILDEKTAVKVFFFIKNLKGELHKKNNDGVQITLEDLSCQKQ